MIKNIKELSALEIEELKTLYIRYFEEQYESEIKDTGIVGAFKRYVGRNNELYADEMLERLLLGINIGYVNIDETINGFIVGRTENTKEAWISHLYVDPEVKNIYNHLYSKRIALRLYFELAKNFKKHGKTKVITEVGPNEFIYRDILETLKFKPQYDDEEEYEEYERKL